MVKKTPKYQDLLAAIEDGSIESASPEILRHYLSILCKNIQQVPKPEDVVMGLTINHVSMKQHIDNLDRQNSKTQKWVMALAIAALLGSGTQIYYARKADKRAVLLSSSYVSQRQGSEIRADIPSSAKLPVFRQPSVEKKELVSSQHKGINGNSPQNKPKEHTAENKANITHKAKKVIGKADTAAKKIINPTIKSSEAKKSHEVTATP